MKTEVYPLKNETFRIIGAAMKVHAELGHGFLEAVYKEALTIVFLEKGIPFKKEQVLDIYYKEILLDKKYVADFLCFGKVIVEIKATEGIGAHDVSQVLNYLKASKKKIGLLINFGIPSLEFKRIIL